MNEEEKREYEELKSLLYTGTISQYGKRKLIDIIEKQQKEIEARLEEIDSIYKMMSAKDDEIEELKDITRAYDGMAGTMPEGYPIIIADKEYFDSGRFIERFISKDKIKEKIKELEKKKDWFIKYKTSDEVYNKIEILEELLGE